MGRLTERKYGEIVSSKREKTQIHCSNFCNNCSQGAGNCGYVREMVEKLAEYEDAEEQGLLLRLPVPIGGKVYSIGYGTVKEDTVVSYVTTPIGRELGLVARGTFGAIIGIIGKSVFATKEEAEQKLEEMKRE